MCQAGGGGVHGAGEGGAGVRAAGHGAAAAARPPAAGRGRRLPRAVQLQQRAVSSDHSEHSYTSTPSIIAFELFSFHGNTFKIISSFLLQTFGTKEGKMFSRYTIFKGCSFEATII